MTYLQLAYLHLATIVPAFLIGTALLFMRKGTPRHRLLGRIYMPLRDNDGPGSVCHWAIIRRGGRRQDRRHPRSSQR